MQTSDIILLTASAFQNRGGWVLDTQFVPTMGMPYLLAHGLGNPVEDATMDFSVPVGGEYQMFVYTFNWVAPWKPQYAPGVFEISVDDRQIGSIFGGTAPEWGWEAGGAVSLSEGLHRLRLHDRTGFEGRIGMIVFSRDPDISLPVGASEVSAFVFQETGTEILTETVCYDLVICGGGIPGICAALSAARNGLKTALIQDRPVVGGNNSSEVRVWLGGRTHYEPFPGIGNIVNEMEQPTVGHYGNDNRAENYEDGKKMGLLLQEENVTLYMEHILTDVEMEGDAIASVIVWDHRHEKRRRIRGALFSDCTGDATLGYLAGADFEVTTNGHMGMTNVWYVEKSQENRDFPECPWAIDLRGVDFPGKPGVKDVYSGEGLLSLGCWFWESGCELDPIAKAEYARDLNFRAMYGAWSTLKNHEQGYENYRLAYSSYIGGKRESRRLLGNVILTKSDVLKRRFAEDGCVPSTWTFDVHYPDKRFYAAFHEGDGFITKDYHESFPLPYFIPYRALYSRNVANLFMAGRNVSVSHDALGTVRVMRTGGMMGEVVGYAARLCRSYGISPRKLYEDHLDEFMAKLKSIPKIKKNKLVANVYE